MRSFRLLVLGGIAAALAGATRVTAQPPATSTPPSTSTAPAAGERDGRARGMRGGGMRRGMRALLMRDITLSDAQRAQIRTIRERHRAQQQALREEVRGRWRGRRDGAAATRPDSATRVARRAEFEAFRGRVRDLRQRQLADIRAVLTPAQQASFDRNVAELRARGAERAARRGQRAPGQEPGRRPARGQRGPGGSPGGTVRGGAPGGF